MHVWVKALPKSAASTANSAHAAGDRTGDLSLASRASYHWATTPPSHDSKIHDSHDSKVQPVTNEAAQWSSNNIIKINSNKTKQMTITFSKKHPNPQPVGISDTNIGRTATFNCSVSCYHQIWAGTRMWTIFMESVLPVLTGRLTLLKIASVAPGDLLKVYISMIPSMLEHPCAVWHTSLTKGRSDKLEFTQKRALRTILPDQSHAQAWTSLGMNTCMYTVAEMGRNMQKAFFRIHSEPRPL